MNKKLVVKHLTRLRQLLEEDKSMCKILKKKSDIELVEFGTSQNDLDYKIESHSKEIKELDEVILSIQLL